MAEVLNRVILKAARLGPGPDQRAAGFLDPGDRHRTPRRSSSSSARRRRAGVAEKAATAVEDAKFPVILNGAAWSSAAPSRPPCAGRASRCAGLLRAISTTTRFPARTRFSPARWATTAPRRDGADSKADVVLALGTRLNPFSTLPGYGIDYWPADADHPGRHQPDRIGLTKKVRGHCRAMRQGGRTGSWSACPHAPATQGRDERSADRPDQGGLGQQLSSMDHEEDDPGTNWNERARADKPDWMSPRMAWRAIQRPCPRRRSSPPTSATTAPSATPIRPSRRAANTWPRAVRPLRLRPAGHRLGAKIACPMSRWSALPATVPSALHERDDRHRPERMAGDHHGHLPQLPVGRGKAEHDPLVRRQLRGHRADEGVSYAGIAKACGLKGVQARTMDELTER
jgi:sulfoacetaldehyde acetyltransferase